MPKWWWCDLGIVPHDPFLDPGCGPARARSNLICSELLMSWASKPQLLTDVYFTTPRTYDIATVVCKDSCSLSTQLNGSPKSCARRSLPDWLGLRNMIEVTSRRTYSANMREIQHLKAVVAPGLIVAFQLQENRSLLKPTGSYCLSAPMRSIPSSY